MLNTSRTIQIIREGSSWACALILAALPFLVALDYGGVLRWTHYAFSLAILLAAVLALPSLTEASSNEGLLRHRLLIPMGLWVAYAASQIVPLPESVVRKLSSGSANAYTDWIAPYLELGQRPSHFPISVARFDSLHVLWVLLVLMAVAWAAAQVFRTRNRISWLLSIIAIGASIHVLLGIWRLASPEALYGSIMTDSGGSNFGAFVNRNNAALLFNLGMAASLGLLSWRLTAMTGLEVDHPSFEFNDLFSLISDRESVVGVLGATVSLTGLLICGSRGGIVAALGGGLLAFGWVRQRRGFISLPVVGLIIAIAAACLIMPFSLDLASIQRFEFSEQQDTSTILRDGRLQHWRDGIEAAGAYFPAGSGLSTYAYAHLPFKKTGPLAWHHHADNLWLELLVEQGLGGIVLALTITFVLIQSLHHLSLSNDPLDQGLRTAGWYAFGAIIVSQFFDFGLIIPANLLVVIAFFATIVSRDASTRISEGAKPGKLRFANRRLELTPSLFGMLALLAIACALPNLRWEAEVESAIRKTQVEFNQIKLDPSSLQQAASDIKEVAGENPPPEVTTILSDLDYFTARVTEVLEANPRDEEEFANLYQETSSIRRRLPWRQRIGGQQEPVESEDDAARDSTRLYKRSLELAGKTLADLPLDSVARTKYVYLDFIHRDSELTSLAIRQLRQIYRNNPPMLMRLGVFAADSGEMEAAMEMWRSTLQQEPAFTGQVIDQAIARGEFEFTTMMPQESRNFRAAARHLLSRGIDNDAFLKESLEKIDCLSCTRLTDHARCDELAGDILYKLGRFDEAFASYRSGINRTPADTNLRFKLVERLRDQGKNQEALIEARIARTLFPQDSRFQSKIEEMARLDLLEVETGVTPSPR